MKIKFDGSNIVLDVHELLSHLPEVDRVKAAESLACDSEIIRHVTAQILDGCTESGYYGSTAAAAPEEPLPFYGLDWAKRQVAKRASEVAANEIARLELALAHASKELQESHEAVRSLSITRPRY